MISIKAKLPAVQMVQPTEVDGCMIVARELLPAVEALSTLPNVPPRAAALLAGHALECALRAFLLHKKVKKARLGKHDLLKLWAMACQERDLNIPQAPPDWCRILAEGHGPDFYFRYQKGKGNTIVHGGQTPALRPMTTALKRLIERVERSIKG
jgi:hypothetical protein